MQFENDDHLDVCQNIEVGLKEEYENNNNLTDIKTIFALENAKIAIKQEFGFAINEINDLNLKEYVKRIDKIKRSVERHSEYGRRGYYEFIKDFV